MRSPASCSSCLVCLSGTRNSWLRQRRLRKRRRRPSSRSACGTGASVAAVRARSCGNLRCAACASAGWRSKGTSPGLRRVAGKAPAAGGERAKRGPDAGLRRVGVVVASRAPASGGGAPRALRGACGRGEASEASGAAASGGGAPRALRGACGRGEASEASGAAASGGGAPRALRTVQG
jgi:hypothetical protein